MLSTAALVPTHPFQDDVQAFVRAWEKLDQYGTSYINVWQLSNLISMVSVCVCVCVCVCKRAQKGS